MNDWTYWDLLFAAIILISTGFALTKGLVREVLSLVALVGGFFLAAFYYRSAALWFAQFSRTEAIANLLGFVAIFLGCILLGAVAAFLVNRLVKMASLQWIDRMLGGIFGFLRGWAIASILVLALIAFPTGSDTLARSRLAPYLLAGARAAVLMVPQDLRTQFNQEYRKVLEAWNEARGPL